MSGLRRDHRPPPVHTSEEVHTDLFDATIETFDLWEDIYADDVTAPKIEHEERSQPLIASVSREEEEEEIKRERNRR